VTPDTKSSKMHDYRIAFFTNTYLPFVGGVPNSVELFRQYLEQLGDHVTVYAPEYEGASRSEKNIRRLPAIRDISGTDFSLPLPINFRPVLDFSERLYDIVHVHHPFLLGELGLTMARRHRVPLVFTYHTKYEDYVHYTPLDPSIAKRTIIEHAVDFCNVCDLVIAPTTDIEKALRERGVESDIEVLPTGIELGRYQQADGATARAKLGLPEDTPVLLHVGRLAKEKNLPYLIRACDIFLRENKKAHVVITGGGAEENELRADAEASPVSDRFHFTGRQTGKDLRSLYAAANLFVFASKSETQGMVLVEAMAAGTPVIALEADGVRDVMRDGENGRMLHTGASEDDFAKAIVEALKHQDTLDAWSKGAQETAERFDMPLLAKRLHGHYEALKALPKHRIRDKTLSFSLIRNFFESVWQDFEDRIKQL